MGGGGSVIFRNFENFRILSQFSTSFPQLLFASPACVLVGALRIPCAEVLLLEDLEGNDTAIFPQFFCNYSAIFPLLFAIGFDAP